MRAAMLLAALTACAAPAAAEGLSGVYTGVFDGKPATLVLEDFTVSVTGRLNVKGGYVILLNGKMTNGAAAGGASSPTGAATFELRPSDSGVTLALEEATPVSGRIVRTRFEFTRAAPAPAESGAASDSGDLQRDARLIGTWQGTRMHHAGDMILRLKFIVELRPDGSFIETADFGSDGSASPVREGRWSTTGGALSIRPAGSGDWIPLGRYLARGEELLLIGADGAAEVWRH